MHWEITPLFEGIANPTTGLELWDLPNEEYSLLPGTSFEDGYLFFSLEVELSNVSRPPSKRDKTWASTLPPIPAPFLLRSSPWDPLILPLWVTRQQTKPIAKMLNISLGIVKMSDTTFKVVARADNREMIADKGINLLKIEGLKLTSDKAA